MKKKKEPGDIRHVNVRVTEELHRPIRARLAEEDRSLQDVIVGLLRQWAASVPATEQAETNLTKEGRNISSEGHENIGTDKNSQLAVTELEKIELESLVDVPVPQSLVPGVKGMVDAYRQRYQEAREVRAEVARLKKRLAESERLRTDVREAQARVEEDLKRPSKGGRRPTAGSGKHE